MYACTSTYDGMVPTYLVPTYQQENKGNVLSVDMSPRRLSRAAKWQKLYTRRGTWDEYTDE